jgi:sporulation protein YlmC with PRC-barrel domain
MKQHEPQPQQAPSLRRVYLSRLRKMPVRVEAGGRWLGKLDDLVVAEEDSTITIVGLRLGSTWGGRDQFIPWDRVVELFGVGIVVLPPEQGDRYPSFRPHSHGVLATRALVGRKIGEHSGSVQGSIRDLVFELAGKDIRLLAVDTSLNGPLRRWGLVRDVGPISERLIAWDNLHLLPTAPRAQQCP